MERMTIVIEQDGDMLVAQCDPFDVATQGKTVQQVLDRLATQWSAEVEAAGSVSKIPRLPTADDVCGILADTEKEG